MKRRVLLLLLLAALCGCTMRVKRITTPIFELEDGYIGTKAETETESEDDNAEY